MLRAWNRCVPNVAKEKTMAVRREFLTKRKSLTIHLTPNVRTATFDQEIRDAKNLCAFIVVENDQMGVVSTAIAILKLIELYIAEHKQAKEENGVAKKSKLDVDSSDSDSSSDSEIEICASCKVT
jgi:hypothetical protein